MQVPPPFKPRTYLPPGIDLGNPAELNAVYADLSRRLASVPDRDGLIAWLALYDELTDAVMQEGIVRTIDYDGDMKNAAYEKAYLDFVNRIDPNPTSAQLETPPPQRFKLLQQLAAHPAFPQLPPYYDTFRRNVVNSVSLFREENDDLAKAESSLAREYRSACGDLTIDLDGAKLTPDATKAILEGTDRAKRQEAWEKVQAARIGEHDHFNRLIDRQLELRQQMAKNAGFENYLDFMYRRKGRFEYTVADTLQMHQAVADHMAPFLRRLQEERRQAMIASHQLAPGETLKPWDLDVDPQGRPPLKPFRSNEEFKEKISSLFHAIHPEMGAPVAAAARDGLIDAENRPAKAPGYGYCMPLPEARRAFFNSNGVGIQEDVGTALHEFGHLIHGILGMDQTLSVYRGEGPLEFCEVASMAMELIGSNHMDQFYPERIDQLRGQQNLLEGFFRYAVWAATTDALQHWMYAHPGHTHEERDAEWARQKERFGGIEDWSGHEDARNNQWQERGHFWSYPLYAVEYLQAANNALEKSAQYDRDPQAAIASHLAGLKLGASRPLPELVKAAGLTFDPRGEGLGASMAVLQKKFDALRAEEKELSPAPGRRLELDELKLVRPALPGKEKPLTQNQERSLN